MGFIVNYCHYTINFSGFVQLIKNTGYNNDGCLVSKGLSNGKNHVSISQPSYGR